MEKRKIRRNFRRNFGNPVKNMNFHRNRKGGKSWFPPSVNPIPRVGDEHKTNYMSNAANIH